MKSINEAREYLAPDQVDVVIYHGGCPDGFGAAFAAWKSLGDNVKYLGTAHGSPYPVETSLDEWKDKNLLIVDFSYSPEKIAELQRICKKVLILDHHKSAMLDHGDTDYSYFDMDRSGATITWDYFNPTKPPPLLLQYIQDRDIWTWKLPDARPFLEAFNLVPQEFSEWNNFVLDPSKIEETIKDGKSIARYTDHETTYLAKKAQPRSLFGYTVGVVNSHTLISDLGNKVISLPDNTFDCALIWYHDPESRQIKCSLRSIQEKMDTTLISKGLGGGGHRNASGFIWKSSDIESLFDSVPRRIIYSMWWVLVRCGQLVSRRALK